MKALPDHLRRMPRMTWAILVLVIFALILPRVLPSFLSSCEEFYRTHGEAGLEVFSDGGEMPWDAVAGFVSGILTFASLLLVALIYYFDSKADRTNARREIYQQLELTSIELFRFECEQAELVSLLWDDTAPPLETLPYAKQYAVKAYVFQLLNLFEMAIRFRKQGIMEPDVFGSWIIWMYELCEAERFQGMWDEIKMNYVGLLAESLTEGIQLCREEKKEGDGKTEFFRMFQRKLHCKAINGYLARLAADSAEKKHA